MSKWPRILSARNQADSCRAAELLWSVMDTDPPAEGPSNIYRLVDAHFKYGPATRRRPIVDELLPPPPEQQKPRALICHDVDSWDGMEQWQEWESSLGLRSVNLLRAPLPEGARLADGTRASYITPPPDYDVEDASVRQVVEAGLARGSEFGLHYASAKPEVVRAEAGRLRDALEFSEHLPATAHWLQSSGAALRALDELGFSHDLSFIDYDSYAAEPIPADQPQHPGFLTGTTHPHLLWDGRRRRWLDLLAVPGALAEVFVAGECPSAPTQADIEHYIGLIREHRGVLVLLWHSERFDLVELLQRLVEHLTEQAFSFVTTADLVAPARSETDAIDDPRA